MITSVGVDIGGTHLRCAIVDEAGSLHQLIQYAYTDKPVPIEMVIEIISNYYHSVRASFAPRGIGISVASPLFNDGTIQVADNLGWHNVPLLRLVSQAVHEVPICATTDVFCGVLAERRMISASDAKQLAFIAIGTGIGHGLMIGRKLITGENNAASVFGHLKVVPDGLPCYCGQRGCLCQYASGLGITNLARDRIADVVVRNSSDVCSLAQSGCIEAIRILDEAEHYLTLALSHLINLFNPGIIVLGGGVINSFWPDVARLDARVRKLVYTSSAGFRLTRSKLGEFSNLIGAASLVYEEGKLDESG